MEPYSHKTFVAQRRVRTKKQPFDCHAEASPHAKRPFRRLFGEVPLEANAAKRRIVLSDALWSADNIR